MGQGLVLIGTWWTALLFVAAFCSGELEGVWPGWRLGFAAAAVWGVNAFLLLHVIGPPFRFSRVPVLSAAFALALTLFGTASYWATTVRFPDYRVNIERAALFVAVCTALSLIGVAVVSGAAAPDSGRARPRFVWDWIRLRTATYVVAGAAVLGTAMTIRKLGFVPALQGDPLSERVEYAATVGLWLKVSTLGMVAALLAAAQVSARRATRGVWLAGLTALFCMALYPNRFFVALPLGVALLLWDRVRARIPVAALASAGVMGITFLSLLFYWRQQAMALVPGLGPLAVIFYATLAEFRDLAWMLDHWWGSDRFLGGATLPGLVVPFLPQQAWALVGIDKAAIFANSSAAVLAHEMGRETAQRVGLYGELFMNFALVGAALGSLVYGLLLGWLDRAFRRARDGCHVSGVLLALVIGAVLYAQVGQWNMIASTIAGIGYPMLLVALFAARRSSGSPGPLGSA